MTRGRCVLPVMGDHFTEVFTPAPFHPPPQIFYDAAPTPSAPPEAPAAPLEAPAAPPAARDPNKRKGKQSRRALESAEAQKDKSDDDDEEWEPAARDPNERKGKQSRRALESAEGAPKAASAAAPRAAAHGWCYGAFKGHSEVKADGSLEQGWLKVPVHIELGADVDENDEATAPVPGIDYDTFFAYVATHSHRAIVAAEHPVPGGIDVGDYYMTTDDRVLRVIGTLMAADDL